RACNTIGCAAPVAGATGTTVLLIPGAPGAVSVPTTSTTGSYTIGWTAGSGSISSYEVYESTSSSFASQTSVYTGTGTSAPISGRGDGTYYYRARACNASGCSGYTAGANGIVVTVPPGTPATISAPTSSATGAYTVSWTAGTGTITSFEVYESTSSTFTTQTSVYTGTGTSTPVSGKGNGTYYYRVRACNAIGCSGYRATTGTAVLLPPGAPGAVNVPTSSTTGSYTISWTAGSGTITSYELYESTSSSFATQTSVYTGTGTSTPISG